jgi:hypothetical protein
LTVNELREVGGADRPPYYKFFIFAAAIAVIGWGGFMLLSLWWLFQPVSLPSIEEPVPVLNENNTVFLGENIEMALGVTKPIDYQAVDNTRYIECASGKLIPLTSGEPRTLPIGTYTLNVDSIILPSPVIDGDSCTVLFRVIYEINPLRDEQIEFRSEAFAVYN